MLLLLGGLHRFNSRRASTCDGVQMEYDLGGFTQVIALEERRREALPDLPQSDLINVALQKYRCGRPSPETFFLRIAYVFQGLFGRGSLHSIVCRVECHPCSFVWHASQSL